MRENEYSLFKEIKIHNKNLGLPHPSLEALDCSGQGAEGCLGG